jgi:hypothetical protein
MLLSAFKQKLQEIGKLDFYLENGEKVASHFHVTEVGVVHKNFIDCGGVVRVENKVNFQLWQAEDYDHVLSATKLLSIIQLSENKLHIGDFEIEVEYQMQTIGKFNLEYINDKFILTNTATNCLALDKCGVESAPQPKNTCTPGGGCC